MDRGAEILKLIAELKAIAQDPEIIRRTDELSIHVMDDMLQVRAQSLTTRPVPRLQPAFHTWALDALQAL